MSIYLIDYENVSLNGLNGIETLNDMDRVYLFYGANPGYIPFEKHILIAKTPAEVHYLRVDRSGKNYLDFQLATYSGYLVAMYASQEYIIVSRDTGFDSIVNFWNRNPDGRDIHFSRREAIVTPTVVRTDVRTDNQAGPVHTAGESAYVPTRQAPIPPSIESFNHDEKGRNPRRDLRSRSNRRGGRNNARNSQINAIGAQQTAIEANELQLNALSETIEEDKQDAYSNDLPETDGSKDAELLSTQPIQNPADSSLLASKTVHEVSASEPENTESESTENEDNVSDAVEKVLPTWQVVTSMAATDGNIGVYVPGTAASGKSNSYPLPSESNLSFDHQSLDNEQSSNEAPSDENVIAVKPSDVTKTEPGTEAQENATDSTAVEQAPISAEEKTEEKPTEVNHDHTAANDAKNDSIMTEDHSLRPSVEQPTRMGRHIVRAKQQRKPALKDAEQKDFVQPEQAAEQTVTASVHQPLRLADRFKSQIRDAVKEEHLNSGGYVQIYNRVLKCDSKSRLNNELVKVFSQDQGSRIYKLILPTYEEYRKSLGE